MQKVSNDDVDNFIKNKLKKYSIPLYNSDKIFKIYDEKFHQNILKSHQHYSYPNTNKPLSLLLITTYRNNPIVLFIARASSSRNKNTQEVTIHCIINTNIPTIYFKDTICEGELYNDVIFLSDLIVHKGMDVRRNYLDKKILMLNTFLESFNSKHIKITIVDFNLVEKEDSSEELSFAKYSGMILRSNADNRKNIVIKGKYKNVEIENPTQTLKKFLIMPGNDLDIFRLYLYNLKEQKMTPYEHQKYLNINDKSTHELFKYIKKKKNMENLSNENNKPSGFMGFCVFKNKKWQFFDTLFNNKKTKFDSY